VAPGEWVLVVDDLLATGSAAAAAEALVRKLGGSVVGFRFAVKLDFLRGEDRLGAKAQRAGQRGRPHPLMFDGNLIRYPSNMKRTAPGPFEALADPTRRAILRRLRSGPLSAGEVGEAFSLTKATLSHHFRILRAAGLVRSEKRGTSVIYTLQSNVLEDVASELLELVERVKPARRARKVTP